jgi:hypothetical protein
MSQSCTIYSRKNEWENIAGILRDAGVENSDNDSESSDNGNIKNSDGTLRLSLRKSFQAGDDFSRMLLGTHNFFSQVETENTQAQNELLNFILSCETAVGIVAEPEFKEEDKRLDIVFAIAELLDGYIFNGSEMLDKNGELVLSAEGESEVN